MSFQRSTLNNPAPSGRTGFDPIQGAYWDRSYDGFGMRDHYNADMGLDAGAGNSISNGASVWVEWKSIDFKSQSIADIVRGLPWHAPAEFEPTGTIRERFDAAVTLFLVLTQDQTGKQLGPGEVMAAELAGIFPQHTPRGIEVVGWSQNRIAHAGWLSEYDRHASGFMKLMSSTAGGPPTG